MYTYKGYSYEPWDDREDDNIKIFHDVYAWSGPDFQTIKVSSRSMPLSPYSKPSEKIFQMWIDCGQPNSKEMGLNGNASCTDIEKYYQRWLDDRIDEEILGVKI